MKWEHCVRIDSIDLYNHIALRQVSKVKSLEFKQRFMHALPRRNISFFANLFNPKTEAPHEVALLKDGVSQFITPKAFSDSEYGGGSLSKVENVNENEIPFLRWSGLNNFDGTHATKSKAKAGYVAVKLVCREPVDVMDNEGFLVEMRVKDDVQLTMNMHCVRSYLMNQHQQNFKLTGGSGWRKFFVPFEKFTAVHNGNEKDYGQANDSLQLSSVGFLMTSESWTPGTVQFRFILLYSPDSLH